MRLGCSLLLLSIPCLVAGQTYRLARVTGEAVNVRSGPGMDSHVLGRLGEDAHAVICEKAGEWWRIFLPRTFHVHLHDKDLSGTGKERICVRDTTARLEPDRHHPAVGTVARNTKVRVVRQYGVWWAVEPPLSLTGFVQENYLEPVSDLSEGDAARILEREILPLGAVITAKAVPESPPVEVVSPEPGPMRVAPAGPAAEGEEAPRGGRLPGSPESGGTLKFSVFTRSEKTKKLQTAFIEERKKPLEAWDFNVAKAVCQEVMASNPTPDEKDFADLVLKEIDFLERVRDLVIPRKREAKAPALPKKPEEPRPLAVGWVRGQGRYIGKAGTHVLEKGGKALYYLEEADVDLDSCVNKLVAIQAGTVEDLPPHYGCRLIRVKSLKVLAPTP